MMKNTCDKHSLPLEGCIVEYFGRECPLCKAEKRIKQLENRINRVIENDRKQYQIDTD